MQVDLTVGLYFIYLPEVSLCAALLWWTSTVTKEPEWEDPVPTLPAYNIKHTTLILQKKNFDHNENRNNQFSTHLN